MEGNFFRKRRKTEKGKKDDIWRGKKIFFWRVKKKQKKKTFEEEKEKEEIIMDKNFFAVGWARASKALKEVLSDVNETKRK